jgi:hypothetical protein
MPVDPKERLQSGVDAMREGRYAEALADFVWFHDNALKHDRSLRGVRLSFALGDWIDLAYEYPPAMQKLESIRDKKTAMISRGKGDYALFNDVASINEYLKEEHRTRELFQHLDRSNPDFAQRCASLAFDALVRGGMYELAHRYMSDTEGALLQLSENFNWSVVYHAPKPPPLGPRVRRVFIQKYCEDIQMRAAVLRNVSQTENASWALHWGIALVEDAPTRKKVLRLLSLSAKD